MSVKLAKRYCLPCRKVFPCCCLFLSGELRQWLQSNRKRKNASECCVLATRSEFSALKIDVSYLIGMQQCSLYFVFSALFPKQCSQLNNLDQMIQMNRDSIAIQTIFRGRIQKPNWLWAAKKLRFAFHRYRQWWCTRCRSIHCPTCNLEFVLSHSGKKLVKGSE